MSRHSRISWMAVLLLMCNWSVSAQPATHVDVRASATIQFGGEFDPKRNPAVDLNSILQISRKSGKAIVLDVGGSWCTWCYKLDQAIREDINTRRFLNDNFLWLKVNYSPENRNEEFLSAYPRTKVFPYLIVLDKNGTHLITQDASIFENRERYDPEKLLSFFQRIRAQKYGHLEN